MRSHPADYELVAPNNLPSVLSLLAQEPGAWLPIAGGTDLMVQYAAGHLAARKLVSIWNLPELRRIEILPGEIRVGAGCTYTDLIENAVCESRISAVNQRRALDRRSGKSESRNARRQYRQRFSGCGFSTRITGVWSRVNSSFRSRRAPDTLRKLSHRLPENAVRRG